MDKHRLELFSDGVFAIILTLMVLELKSPDHADLAGLWQIAPALLVHALAFAQVGSLWVSHNRVFVGLHGASMATLWLNLLALFWATLVPFGARLAAEDIGEPLGASIQLFCAAAYYLTLYTMHPFQLPDDATPAQRSLHRKRLNQGRLFIIVVFAGSLLAWLSPFIGYALIGATFVSNIVRPSMAADLNALGRQEVRGQA